MSIAPSLPTSVRNLSPSLTSVPLDRLVARAAAALKVLEGAQQRARDLKALRLPLHDARRAELAEATETARRAEMTLGPIQEELCRRGYHGQELPFTVDETLLTSGQDRSQWSTEASCLGWKPMQPWPKQITAWGYTFDRVSLTCESGMYLGMNGQRTVVVWND